jgi:cell division protein FtsL
MTTSARPISAPGIGSAGFRVAIDHTRPRAGNRRIWLLLALTVATAFFLMIWSRIALDHTAFVLQEIGSETAQAEARYWDLRVESARLQAPDRIIEAAIGMGMVYPDTVRTVEVAGLGGGGSETEQRWVGLKAVLGAQP